MVFNDFDEKVSGIGDDQKQWKESGLPERVMGMWGLVLTKSEVKRNAVKVPQTKSSHPKIAHRSKMALKLP